MDTIGIDNVFDVLSDGLRDDLVLSEGGQGAVNVGPKFFNESDGRMSLLRINVGRDSLDKCREKVNGV